MPEQPLILRHFGRSGESVNGKTTTFMSASTERSIKDRRERICGNPPEDRTTQNQILPKLVTQRSS
jgi:hypothetical protein